MNPSSNTSSDPVTSTSRDLFGMVFGALVLVGNLLILAAAWRDRSWGALAMAITYGPMLNGALLISGLVAIPFLKRRRQHFSTGQHLALTVAVPITAIVADFMIIRLGLLR